MIKGIISAINGEQITVLVQCQSACAKCVQHHVCPLDIREKKVTVTTPKARYYNIGQEISLTISKRNMVLSLLFAYAIPLFLLLFMIGLGVINKWTEVKTGVIALSTLIPYYMFLLLFNSRLKKHFTIEIAENSVD